MEQQKEAIQGCKTTKQYSAGVHGSNITGNTTKQYSAAVHGSNITGNTM
jgi:hypothetical protein